MTEVSYLSLLIAGELLVILSLACGISLFRSIRNKKRDYQAARKLVAAIKQDEDRHTTFVHKLLESGYKYEGEELEQTVRDLIRAEKMFYQTLINTYLKRDAGTFGDLNITLEALTDIYEQLKVPAVSGGSDAGDGSGNDVDLEYLRDKNQRLSEELSETMDTMGRMLSEYSNMLEDKPDEAGEEKSPTNITGENGQDALNNGDETDLAELELPPQPAPEATDPQVHSIDSDVQAESFEMTEDGVDELLEDLAKQVENNVELPAEESGALDSGQVDEADDPDATQVVGQQDLSVAFDDLEEIDIDVEGLPQAVDGKSTRRGS
jgi:hypothetical protein